jgi:hypothetical protein
MFVSMNHFFTFLVKIFLVLSGVVGADCLLSKRLKMETKG